MSYDATMYSVLSDTVNGKQVNSVEDANHGDRNDQPFMKRRQVSLMLVLMFAMAVERVIGGYYFNMNHLENSLNSTESMAAGFVIKLAQPNFRLFLALGCSFLLPLMGGLLGDGILGRFKCAFIGETLHIAVSIFFTASLLATNEKAVHALVYTADFLLVFCFGILVVNIQAMGACLAEASGLLRQSTYFAVISTIQIALIAPGVQLSIINETKYKIVIHCTFFAVGVFCFFLLYSVRNCNVIVQTEPRRVYKVIKFVFCGCCPRKVPLIQQNITLNNSYRKDARKFTSVLPFLTALIVNIVNVYFSEKFLNTNPTLDVLIIFSPLISGLLYIFVTIKLDHRLSVTHRIHMGISLSTLGFIASAISVILGSELLTLNAVIIFFLTFGQIIIFSVGKEMVCAYLPKNMEAIAIGLYETSFGLSTVILYGIGMYSQSITALHAFIGIVSMTVFIAGFQVLYLIYCTIRSDYRNSYESL